MNQWLDLISKLKKKIFIRACLKRKQENGVRVYLWEFKHKCYFSLTVSTPLWSLSADDKLISAPSPKKIEFDTSCRSSAKETIFLQCQILFSGEIRKISKCRLLKTLTVNTRQRRREFPFHEKSSRHIRTAKAQIRLRFCAVWSGPSLSAYKFNRCCRAYLWKAKAQIILHNVQTDQDLC